MKYKKRVYEHNLYTPVVYIIADLNNKTFKRIDHTGCAYLQTDVDRLFLDTRWGLSLYHYQYRSLMVRVFNP